MPARTHRYALELYGKGDSPSDGHHGLYLPRENLTDMDTSGQLSYAEGSGIITLSPLKISHTDVAPFTLDVNSNVTAASQSVVKISQDHTTGAQSCLELNQDDTNVPAIKLSDATGSCLLEESQGAGTVISDWGFAISIGTSDYIIPLLVY